MKKATIAMLLALFLAGCSKTLTRGKASDIIREKFQYHEGRVYDFHPTHDEIERGKKAGLWTADEVTEYGKKYFYISPDCHCMRTLNRMRPAIEITGITGDGEWRTVLYTLHWFDELPRDVKAVFTESGREEQSCFMHLYDDGWRIE